MLRYFILFVSVLFLNVALSQTVMAKVSRIALIIGNSDYKNAFIGKYPFEPLDNPVNDAVDMAKVLRNLGFEVILKTNLKTKAAMKKAVLKFRRRLSRNGGVGLFYFSGHGFQYENVNYLVPLHAVAPSEVDIEDEMLTTNYVLRHLEGVNNKGVNLIVLDACRDSIPSDFFENRENKGMFTEDLKAGFTNMKAPVGSLIAYSTAPNTTSWGVPGERNSIYTKYLLKELRAKPQLNVSHLLMAVRNGVLKETQDEEQQQEPWEHISLTAPFCFKSPCLSEQEKRLQDELVALKEKLRQQTNLTQQIAKLRQLQTEKQSNVPDFSSNTFRAGKTFRDSLRDGSKAPEMVWIPAGRFRMGAIQGGGYSDEKPVHWVNIKKFAMGKYEVTFAEYDKFANATGREKPNDRGWGRGNRPVINVSWYDAVAYAKWLSQQTGKEYCLPSEAEWEYAARAGTETKYWWGNDIGKNRANCSNSYCGDKFKYTSPVGSFSANPFGLYDTVGNVWEWVADGWHKDYTNAPNDGRIWAEGADKSYRVLRGGSWYYVSNRGRVAYRNWGDPVIRSNVRGFRVVRCLAART
ncbi:SUMF1/EgtB/PvdO family nonheme iron enzyme [Candidatus Parabeggiatoa sp. HSG14]|uniref:SUMF1/EgtB/PvdO family nonheme iron enzyme n=1 Tax=Candidatus Parabeggiatoa sp. HSG14 TaxID=3055593 RepID=UPI0025A6CB62|nr:SUMF1/EgtB/PvdO family nonheme iron enzyme [Thiotrichales bacterium HSG14]